MEADFERDAVVVDPEGVVEELVVVVPEPARALQRVHRICNEHEVLKELGGHVLVDGIDLEGQFQGHLEHVWKEGEGG